MPLAVAHAVFAVAIAEKPAARRMERDRVVQRIAVAFQAVRNFAPAKP